MIIIIITTSDEYNALVTKLRPSLPHFTQIIPNDAALIEYTTTTAADASSSLSSFLINKELIILDKTTLVPTSKSII